MKTILLVILVLVLAILAALWLWRQADHRADRAEWARLAALQPKNPAAFDPAMVAGLPEPVRRFFAFAIQPGTPLFTVAELDMTGRFSLGTKEAPNYLPMTARQILAAPEGFVWIMSGAKGFMRVSGSDTGTWTRFWLYGLGPVARAGATADHARSAFGRYVGEAVFWTPAALLPGPNVRWEAVDENTARVIVTRDGLEQPVELTVDAEGRPLRIVFPRWTNANPDKVFRLQPFGGTLSEFRDFGGYRLPTHVEAGNFFGTDDWFPFFIADITDIRFPR
jgi:hypothetical protein